MKSRGLRLFSICLFACVMCLFLVSDALAATVILPDGLKDHYDYYTTDSSIIIVKRRLAELGYLSDDKIEVAFIGNTLKDAVISFQKDHNLKPDGELDRELFYVLFGESSDPVSKETSNKTESSKQTEGTKKTGIITDAPIIGGGSGKTANTTKEGNEEKTGFSSLIIILILVGVGAVAALVIVLVAKSISRKNLRYVMEHSRKYIEITKLNQKYSFYVNIPGVYVLSYRFQSKRALDNADTNEYFIMLANEDDKLKEIVKKITYNRNLYDRYLKEYAQLDKIREGEMQTDFNPQKFINIENKICKQIEHPATDIAVEIRLYYTSPKGQKRYYKTANASYGNLQYAYLEADNRQTNRLKAEIERSKMSASLRYDILQRDGFRCTICGATQKDGVKLHVDHIVPVSRGGLTVRSNLRTLCDRCNLGKSDKYSVGSLN